MKNSNKGFTLIEVLITLFCISIILTAIYSTFFTVSNAIRGVDESILKLQEARAFMDIMRREIEAVQYKPDRTDLFFRFADKGNGISSLEMTTASPAIKGISQISYFAQKGEKGIILKKSIRSLASKASDDFELLSDVGKFELKVRQSDGDVTSWNTSVVKKMPVSVDITLVIKMKSGDGFVDFSLSETAIICVGEKI